MTTRNYDAERTKRERDSEREARVKLQLETESRRQRRDARTRLARESHAEAFSKPLISNDLLTDAERKAIRDRVANRGRWYTMFGGKGSIG